MWLTGLVRSTVTVTVPPAVGSPPLVVALLMANGVTVTVKVSTVAPSLEVVTVAMPPLGLMAVNSA